jgi:TP901 family phage tail tape measure protein
MGRKIYDEDLRLNLILNGEPLNKGSKLMVAALGKLEREMVNLEQAAKASAAKIKLLEQNVTANAGALKRERQNYANTTLAIQAQQKAIDDLRKQIGLAGMTVGQLSNHLKALRLQLHNTAGDIELQKRLRKEIAETEIMLRTRTTGASRLAQAWERVERTVNKAGTIVGYTAMAVFGVVRLVTSVITRMKDLEDLIGSVRKNTDLTVGAVWELKYAFDQMDTRTSTDDLLKLAVVAGKLGVSGKKDIEKFVEAANMIQVALGDDLNGTVEDTITSIAKLMNAFRIDKEMPMDKAMLKTGSVLNELAKSSAASAETILNYMTRLSSVGELAGFSIAQIAGIGSTLDAMNVPSERGATAIQKIMLALANPKKINDFAEALGTTAKGYKEMLVNDPNKAMINLLTKFVSTKKGLVELTGGLKDFGAKGQYMTAVLGSLAQNLDVLVVQQEIGAKAWDAGTSVLQEYNIMNSNFTSEVLKQQRVIKATTDQMNLEVEPAVLSLVKTWTRFVVMIKDGTDWIGNHWQAIRNLTAAYILFKAPAIWRVTNLILEDLWLRKVYASEAIKLFWTKASVIWTRNLNGAQTAAMMSSRFLTIANIALTQGLRAAIAEMRIMAGTATAMAFPIVAAIIAIAAIAAAVGYLVYKRKELTEVEKRQQSLQKEMQKDFITEKANLTVMMDRLKNVNLSQEDRLKIIKEINSEYGEYLPNLLSENATADDLAKSYDLVVEALARKILFKKTSEAGAANRIAFDLNEAEIKQQKEVLAAYKETNEAKLALSNPEANVAALFTMDQMNRKIKELTAGSTVLENEYAKLQSTFTKLAPKPKLDIKGKPVIDTTAGEETFKMSQKVIKDGMDAEELAIKNYAFKTQENSDITEKKLRASKIAYMELQLQDIRAKHRDEGTDEAAYTDLRKALVDEQLAGLKDVKKAKGDARRDDKELLRDLESDNNKELTLIHQKYATTTETEAEYNSELLTQEFKFLNDKVTLFKEGADKYNKSVADKDELGMAQFKDSSEQYNKAVEDRDSKTVQYQIDLKNRLRKTEEDFDAAKIQLMDDDWNKAAAIEDERWAKQLYQLESELIVGKTLNDAEVALNKAKNDQIEANCELHEKAMAEITAGGRGEEAISKATFDVWMAQYDEKAWEKKEALARAEYANEVALAKKNGPKLQTAAMKLADALVRIKTEEIERKRDLSLSEIGVAKTVMEALAVATTQGTALAKAVYMMQQGLAIAEVWVKNASSNAIIAANLLELGSAGGPPGLAAATALAATTTALNTASAVAATALIAAQTFVGIKQAAKGIYPVIGEDDGRLYAAGYGGSTRTGVYDQPTLLDMAGGRTLVGERAPELVVDGATFRKMQINAPQMLRDIYAFAGKTPQRASGSYPTGSAQRQGNERVQITNYGDPAMKAAILELTAQLKRGIKANINKYGRNGLSDALDDITNFKTKVGK